jgi:hypothetical protein
MMRNIAMHRRSNDGSSRLALVAMTAASVALLVSALALWMVVRVADTTGTVVAQALQPSAAIESRWPAS